MTLEQIDQQIAKRRELQSQLALKLVDLDEMPTYQGIRDGLFQGTTAAAIGQLGDAIYRMWTFSALIDEALGKIRSTRSHVPMPWDKEKWLRELAGMMVDPIIVRPPTANLTLSDVNDPPTLSLVNAFSELMNLYEKVLTLVRSIDDRVARMSAKMDGLKSLAQNMGRGMVERSIEEIANEIKADPLGVSLDSFNSIESKINRFNLEASDHQAILDSIELGVRKLSAFGAGNSMARQNAERCHQLVGTSRPIPEVDIQDLVDWSKTLRNRLQEGELASVRVGVAKWQNAVERLLDPLTAADAANRDLLNRYQEVQGRFSAARAKASASPIKTVQADQLAATIKARLASSPKDISELERLLMEFEHLVL